MIKILIVDDEVDICDFLKNFFRERNFKTLVAHNGKEAMRLVEDESPEIVILDINMPIMNGIETLKEIKKTGNSCSVIMVSGVRDVSKIEETKKLGAVEYIAKPLLLDHLESTVLAIAKNAKIDTNF